MLAKAATESRISALSATHLKSRWPRLLSVTGSYSASTFTKLAWQPKR
jgi:hypothetical protein